MIFFLLFVIVWIYIGLIILKAEVKMGNIKLLNLNFSDYLRVAIKACFYGPFTKKRVIDKL